MSPRAGASAANAAPAADAEQTKSAAQAESAAQTESRFCVSLEVFDGPFDLLLNLIGKHELDITEVSLSLVTDEFIAHLATLETQGTLALDQASEFIVVAATLLDLKIASLLPQGEVVDPEEIALLEARDLLFARLLQYRAFKQLSSWFKTRLLAETRRHFRQVPLEEKYRAQAPPLHWNLTAADFAAIATLAFTPHEIPTIGLNHLHAPLVSIREQAAIVVSMLKSGRAHTFGELISAVQERGVIVARFLAVLELYRRDVLLFQQAEPLGELVLEWAGAHWDSAELATLGNDYD